MIARIGNGVFWMIVLVGGSYLFYKVMVHPLAGIARWTFGSAVVGTAHAADKPVPASKRKKAPPRADRPAGMP